MSLIQHHMYHHIFFTNLDLWSFSQGDLLQDCSEQWSCTAFHVSLAHPLSLIFRTPKVQSVQFMEHLQKFYLDLCSPIYFNSPQVSCLRMNSGRGWNPNLEGSYLLENSEPEAEFWIQCTSGLCFQTMKFSIPDPFPILGYSKCIKT